MKKLELRLSQDYKSFPNGFNTVLKGELVILSGVNGSGKTQLFDIIRGFHSGNRANVINHNLQIDGVMITSDQITHRSIRDLAGTPFLGHLLN